MHTICKYGRASGVEARQIVPEFHRLTRTVTMLNSTAKDFPFRIWLAAACVLAAVGYEASAGPLFSDGHGDIGVEYDEVAQTFELHIHLHSGAVVDGVTLGTDEEYDPGDVTILVTTQTARPAGSQFDFTGTGAGQPLWRLFSTLVPGTPFLGLSSEELDSADWVGGELLWEVTSLVSAPAGGQFSLWQSDLSGPSVLAASFNGLPGSFSLPAGGHAHANFGFTAPGLYQVEFTVTGEHETDGRITGTGVFTFQVAAVPEPGGLTLAAIAACGLGWGFRRPGRRLRAPVEPGTNDRR